MGLGFGQMRRLKMKFIREFFTNFLDALFTCMKRKIRMEGLRVALFVTLSSFSSPPTPLRKHSLKIPPPPPFKYTMGTVTGL